jgi:hypothetical protein
VIVASPFGILEKAKPLPLFRTPFAALIISSGMIAMIGGQERQDGLEILPLKARSGSPTDKLFDRLDPEQTGVRFVRHEVDRSKLPDLSGPHSFSDKDGVSGVCAGDFDGDGRPDLFFSYPYGGHRLFRNLGDFKFSDVTGSSGLVEVFDNHWATGCSFVDYDGDGDLDLFVAGFGDVNLLLENDGMGKFRDRAKEWKVSAKGANEQMAFADYDLDGDLDGYLVTYSLSEKQPPENAQVEIEFVNGEPRLKDEQFREVFDVVMHPVQGPIMVQAGEFDHLFRNDGDTFTEVGAEVGIQGTDQGFSASWFDYDDDGDPDLYVANDFFGPDRLYRNEGGKLVDVTRMVLPHIPWFSMGTDIADINNDGLLDLMASDMAGSNHYKSKMGMGDMEKTNWFLGSSNPQQYMRNALFVNAGGGHFLEAAHMAGLDSTDWTWSLKFGDLDNDGWTDLFVTNGMTHDQTNSDLLNQLATIASPEAKSEFWRKTPPKRDKNFAFQNKGDLEFASVGADWGLDFEGVSFGASLADFDGDGDLDLAVASLEDPMLLYRNNSTTGQVSMIHLVGADRNTRGIGAKVTIETELGRQVRYLTSCQGYASANDPVIHFGLGEAKTIKRLSVRWPRGEVQEFKNLPVNRLLRIKETGTKKMNPTPDKSPPLVVKSKALESFVHRENNFDDFKVQPLLPNRLSRLGPGMAWGDIDGDGDEDVYLGGGSGQEGTLALDNGSGVFTKRPQQYFSDQSLIPFEDMGALFLDADSDGDLDLFVVSGGFDPRPNPLYLRDRLYLNDGRGNFALAHDNTENHRDSGGPVAAADFDRDGDLDLFVGGRVVKGRYPTSPNSRILRNDKGKFTDITDTVAPGLRNSGMACGALWSDYDNDGWIDLLVTYEWGTVRIWKNSSGRFEDRSKEAGTASQKGWWTGLAAADVDEDGDLDYIVGNLGYNTKYEASSKSPYLAYYGDMDGSGRARFVEAKEKKGVMLPVRGKSCSTNAMPSLAQKFPTFHKFASSTLSEIYTPEALKSAMRLEINELATGIFFNDGKGHFEFRPLPRLAQISATFGIATPDLNADGHVDLVLAQNFFSPQVETGRFDGSLGLILLGDGTGSFEPLPFGQSGFLLPGDAMALSAVDLNGDARPDLVSSVNQGAPGVFLNGVRSGKPLAIHVVGSKGNLRGVGSQLTLHFKSGATRVMEVHSGSSYLTGNSTVLFTAVPKGDALQSVTIRLPDGSVRKPKVTDQSGQIFLSIQ